MGRAGGASSGAGGAPPWELGSEFHLRVAHAGDARPPPWEGQGLLVGCGRDALRLLLEHGQRERGWRRLWVPSYFCPEVVAAARETGLAVSAYGCLPLGLPPPAACDPPRAGPGDVVLQVNYFGLEARGVAAGALELAGAERIEDHTHDPCSPWARRSRADFCLASLRKTLPLPDGGALWSPAGHALPAAPPLRARHRAAAARKLVAMALKARYLEGRAVPKAVFRRLAAQAESALGVGPASAISAEARALLGGFPVERWRARRRDNHRLVTAALADVPGLRVAQPADGERGCPSSAMLVFASGALRDAVRAALLEAGVYPAILWPAQQGAVERALSARLLSLPCDMRYGARDVLRAAEHVRAALRTPPRAALTGSPP